MTINIDELANIEGIGEASQELLVLASGATFHSNPYINGEFADIKGAKTLANITPINGSLLTEVVICDDAIVDKAARAADDAFEVGPWRKMALSERKSILLRLASLMEENADELAVLDALDMGKPFRAARGVDVTSAIRTMRWYAEAIDKVYGRVAPTSVLDFVVREPIGVVAAIVPFNYPLMIGAWKFAPILAAGNSLVIKPSEESPSSMLRMAELATEAGIPKGVFNVVTGPGELTGAALARHQLVRSIAFTGSTNVGKALYSYAAQSSVKSISLELGGKAPAIVCSDSDVESAARMIASGVFYNAGQSCNSPARAIVHRSVTNDFLNALKVVAAEYQPGHPLKFGIQRWCSCLRTTSQAY